MRLLFALFLLACTPKPKGPTVLIHYVYPWEWTPADRDYVKQVQVSWRDLGMKWVFTDDPSRTPNHCPKDWYVKKMVSCTIDVGLIKNERLKSSGKAGLSDRATGESWIEAGLTGLYLLSVVAHEVGHQVLDTATHLIGPGIMKSGSGEVNASSGDKALACQNIKRGC